jgi:hypothetical protein
MAAGQCVYCTLDPEPLGSPVTSFLIKDWLDALPRLRISSVRYETTAKGNTARALRPKASNICRKSKLQPG